MKVSLKGLEGRTGNRDSKYRCVQGLAVESGRENEAAAGGVDRGRKAFLEGGGNSLVQDKVHEPAEKGHR